MVTNGDPQRVNQLTLPELNPGSCTSQGLTAFENLVVNYPNQPCLLARLAKIYVRLQHIHGANVIYTKKLSSIENYTTKEPWSISTKVREHWSELHSVM